MYPNVHSSTTYNSQDMEATQSPSADEWIKTTLCVHTHTHTHTQEYYSAIKKNEIFSFSTTCMALEGIMLGETSQTKEKQTPYDFTYM